MGWERDIMDADNTEDEDGEPVEVTVVEEVDGDIGGSSLETFISNDLGSTYNNLSTLVSLASDLSKMGENYRNPEQR